MDDIGQKLNALSDSIVPGLNEQVNFTVVDTPVQEFLRGVAETHHLNISVDPKINIRVTNNFTNAIVKDVILFLVREYHLDIKFVNSIMSFHAFDPPEPDLPPYVRKRLSISYDKNADKLSVDLSSDSLTVFARQLTQVTNKNVILSPGASNILMDGYISEMPFDQALEKIAFANNLSMEKTDDGFYILESLQNSVIPPAEPGLAQANNRRHTRNSANRNNHASGQQNGILIEYNIVGNDTLLSVDAVNAPVAEVIKQASYQLDKNYLIFSEPAGNTTSNVKNITYDELLTFLLQASPHTYRQNDGVYLIGERIKEGFRSTELVKLQFRTVEEIDLLIPAEMTQGVDMKIFSELNSLILSGGKPQINEIRAFIKAIDQPVPNILIEVIVVDVKKGKSLETGIQAFLADSVPQTNGQVFPGVDVTLSSKSINDFLGKLNSKGIINIGKVTPNFYATLKAMENNNNLEIRSTPKLATLNSHEATLTIGESVYFFLETQNITGGVTPITTVSRSLQQVEANLNINIKPIVSGDDHITLTIDAEFSNFTEPSVAGAPPGNATRQFSSLIRIKNEEMIVLGGLEEARKSKTRSGLPILARIPILSWLFSSRSDVKNDSKLLVFIKPTVVY